MTQQQIFNIKYAEVSVGSIQYPKESMWRGLIKTANKELLISDPVYLTSDEAEKESRKLVNKIKNKNDNNSNNNLKNRLD